MKLLLINGSPKAKDSASGIILDALLGRIGPDHECIVCHGMRQGAGEIIESARGADALVFVFPLYVDGIPSHLLKLLEEISPDIAAAAPNARVYAVVNNGFYEGKQNALALRMMRHFCARSGLDWGQGLGVGAGGMAGAAPVGHGPMKRLGLVLDKLAAAIRGGESGEDGAISPNNFPRFLYQAAAHMGWRSQAKKNGLKSGALYDKPSYLNGKFI